MSNQPLLEFVCQVVAYLDGWDLAGEQQYSHIHVDGPDGAAISIGVDGFNDFGPNARVEVSGCWPKAVPTDGTAIMFCPRGESVTIRAAVGRGPEAVAGDIARRLLPKYLPLYREQVRQRDQYLVREARRTECMDRLAEVAGSETGTHDGKMYISAGETRVDAEIGVYDDGARVTMKLYSVPFEKALRVVEILERE